MKIKKQSTCETCLPICLIALLRDKGIKIKYSEEINILVGGIRLTRLDYSTGQLIYICNKHGVEIEQYLDNQIYYKILSKLKYPKNLRLIYRKITKKFLREIVSILPVIVYVDLYYFGEVYHYPHFIILTRLNEKYVNFLDPSNGKLAKMKTRLFIRAIQSLRNKLKICPKVIRIV